jgi:hypothetical protein
MKKKIIVLLLAMTFILGLANAETFDNLTVTGNAEIQGNLTLSGDLIVNGHIILDEGQSIYWKNAQGEVIGHIMAEIDYLWLDRDETWDSCDDVYIGDDDVYFGYWDTQGECTGGLNIGRSQIEISFDDAEVNIGGSINMRNWSYPHGVENEPIMMQVNSSTGKMESKSDIVLGEEKSLLWYNSQGEMLGHIMAERDYLWLDRDGIWDSCDDIYVYQYMTPGTNQSKAEIYLGYWNDPYNCTGSFHSGRDTAKIKFADGETNIGGNFFVRNWSYPHAIENEPIIIEANKSTGKVKSKGNFETEGNFLAELRTELDGGLKVGKPGAASPKGIELVDITDNTTKYCLVVENGALVAKTFPDPRCP